ncbi:hypothetical protein [Neorhizobium sp. JUb45]|uniref:hypothetical protein n=1 Tax=Neorhizobium sp. JUb45 TaxID=2485113 RepID=UPI00104EF665|nr:hypothetical protein [Neorhizobium sp. JUb45]TCR04058.1 hypothetical protein EDF70_102154 [Neorhizobium sp. JUb45]
MSSVNQHAADIIRTFQGAAVEAGLDPDLDVLQMTKEQLEAVAYIFGMVIAMIYVDKQHLEAMGKSTLRARRAA